MTPEQFNNKHIYAYCAKYGGCTSVPLWTRIARKNASAARRFSWPAPPKAVKALLVKPADLAPEEWPTRADKKKELEETIKEEAPMLNIIIEISTLYLVVTCQVESTGCLLVEYEKEVDRWGAFRIGDFEKYTQAFQCIALQHLQASRKRYITYLIG